MNVIVRRVVEADLKVGLSVWVKTALIAAVVAVSTSPGAGLERPKFEVATLKVEYVDSLCAVRARHLRVRDQWVGHFRRALLQGAAHRGIRLAMPATVAAQGLEALVGGLIQNWLLDPQAFDLEPSGMKAVDTYLRGLGLG